MRSLLRPTLALALLASCESSPAPVADASVTDAPATDAPATDAPVTDAPVTDAPVTDAPVTDAPVTDAPVTDASVTDAPVADAPVTDAPAADASDASSDVLVNGCPSLRERLDSPPDGGVDAGAPSDAGDGGADTDAGVDTWSSFAQGFFAQWCTRCHSVTLTDSSSRRGAPAGYNWDVESSVRMRLEDIRLQVGVLNAMPFNPPNPMCDERRRIVLWIDRGAR